MAIARAIVSDPTLLVCDEPTGDLDRATADEVLRLLQMLNREHGKTVVMVTHDPKAAEYARRARAPRQGHDDRGARLRVRYLPLLWAGLFRKKTRTILTLLSIVVAFALFGLLQAVQVAFESGADAADAKRLLTTARYSIIEPLPMSYLRRIEQVPGVVGVAYADWFGAKYQNESNAFPVFAVDPARYLDMYPEFTIDPRAARGLRADAHRRDRGQAAGRSLRLEGRAEAADQLGDPRQDRTAA